YFSRAQDGDFVRLIAPTRVIDSRASTHVGPYSTRWPANTSRDVTIAGGGGVPATAEAVILHVTAVGPSGNGFATVYPSRTSRPTASNLNFVANVTVPNAVTVELGSGHIAVFTSAATDILVDVVGYYDPDPAGDVFHAVAPARIIDSRPASQVGPSHQ